MPFVPDVIGKDLIFSAFLVVAIVTCALVFGPAGPNGPPNPTLIHTAPKPDFYFLPVYAILALLPAYMETFLLLVAPVIGLAILILLPFYSGTGEKSYRRRPMAIVIVVVAFLTVGITCPSWNVRAMVSTHGRVEWRANARWAYRGSFGTGTAGRASHSREAMPKLSQSRR